MFARILVICTGNVCRSPIAEFLLRHRLRESGRPVEIRSAGVAALVDHGADEQAARLMSARGVDLSPHRARQASQALCRWADLVLVMQAHHRETVSGLDPAVRGKTFLLGHWQNQEIPDPYQRPDAVWQNALQRIDEGIDAWARRL